MAPLSDREKAAGAVLTFPVGADHAGARLDKWLSECAESLTRTRIKALIEGGALDRDGATFRDPSWKIREGETFALTVPPIEPPTPRGEAIALDIRHEDADLIVVNKPAGLVVHPAAGNWKGTLVNALIAHCGSSLSGAGGVARPGIVHRLDKETSGLLVAAKNDAAHQGLVAQFAAHQIERAYDALAIGAPRPGVGVIRAPLRRGGGDRKKVEVAKEEGADARSAVTHYRVREAFGRSRARLDGDALASLIECRLETGRTHQIRVHLAHIGCPLIGDPTYGRGPGIGGLKPGDPAADSALAVIAGFRRQALHARLLGFVHPLTGARLSFEAKPPEDFAALAAALRAL